MESDLSRKWKELRDKVEEQSPVVDLTQEMCLNF